MIAQRNMQAHGFEQIHLSIMDACDSTSAFLSVVRNNADRYISVRDYLASRDADTNRALEADLNLFPTTVSFTTD